MGRDVDRERGEHWLKYKKNKMKPVRCLHIFYPLRTWANMDTDMCTYVYVYIYIHIHKYICMYIHGTIPMRQSTGPGSCSQSKMGSTSSKAVAFCYCLLCEFKSNEKTNTKNRHRQQWKKKWMLGRDVDRERGESLLKWKPNNMKAVRCVSTFYQFMVPLRIFPRPAPIYIWYIHIHIYIYIYIYWDQARASRAH